MAASRRYPEDPWTVTGPFIPGVCQLTLSNLPGSAGIPSHRVSRRIKVEENIPRYENFDILTGSVTGLIVFARTSI